MASRVREIRGRLTAIRKTQKITSAMKMLSAARLARAQQAIVAARPYAAKLAVVLEAVSGGVERDAHALLAVRTPARKLDLVVVTSDRGLCGAYNTNLVKLATGVIREKRAAGIESVSLFCVGRRGRDAFRKQKAELVRDWTGVSNVTPALASEIAGLVMERFSRGESDEVVVVFGRFASALTQTPTAQRLLPVETESNANPAALAYEIEPDAETLFAQLLPRAVEFGVFRALLENQASEHGARMTAMDNATNNTQELITSLTLDMNKARQASITAELAEIVGGAEAL